MAKKITMVYPEEFKARMLKAFPKFKHLAQQMENGECIGIGKFLQSWCTTPSWDTILRANSLEQLQELAKNEQERCNLYQSWCDLHYAQHPDEYADFFTTV